MIKLEKAAFTLKNGGIAIYPTETFYAIGCLPSSRAAINHIYEIKKRMPEKPLPMLAGNLPQADMVADVGIIPGHIITNFWPGPLTILLPAKLSLPHQLYNRQRLAAIRVTDGEIAAYIANLTDSPLVSTSANFSGRPPASRWNEIDKTFLHALKTIPLPVAIISHDANKDEVRLPSTIISIDSSKNILKILRKGAISEAELKKSGMHIIQGECV